MSVELRAEDCPTGYTPRVFTPNGVVKFGTWSGPQTNFWDYRGRYGFMGGSTYTGKTDLLRWYPFQQIEHDNVRIAKGDITESFGQALYLLRETPRLREVINRCSRDFQDVCPDAEWKAQPATWVFPSGYRLTFGHMQHEEDWQKYQGWQITCLLWDELPSFLLPQFDMMDQWVRQPAGSDLVPIHRAGGNPVGIGRPWVKKFFDIGKKGTPPGTEIVRRVTVEVEDVDGTKRKETVTRSRMFIFAKVSDNKSVDQAAYLASFDGKPKHLVRAMRDGDFDSVAGDLIGEAWDETVHVVPAYKLPASRSKFRACFYSFAATMVKWFAVDYEGNMTCYRELRLENHTAEMVADRIHEAEEEAGEWRVEQESDGYSKLTGVLGPPEAWAKTGQRGPSPADDMRRLGVSWRPADENPKAGCNQIRTRLIRRTRAPGAPRKSEGVPGLRYFDTCPVSIEAVPSMPASKEDKDLPDKDAEASAYRALCYAVMSRPVVPERELPRDDDWDNAPKPGAGRGARTGFPGSW